MFSWARASKRAVAVAPRHGSRQGWAKGSRKREPEPAAHSCHRVKFSGSPRLGGAGDLGKGSRRHQSGRCVTSPGRPDWRADPDAQIMRVRFQRTHLRASHDSLPSSSDETVLGRPRSGITGHIFHFVSTNHDGYLRAYLSQLLPAPASSLHYSTWHCKKTER